MFDFFKKKESFPDIDWYCDDCNDYLNSQSGFHGGYGLWTCTKCGYINSINEDEIIGDDDFDDDSFGNNTDICERCGDNFRLDDARTEFDSHFNYDLSYDSEFHRGLCGTCAIVDIEGKIAAGMATVPDSDKPDSDEFDTAMEGNNDGTCANCGQSISRGSLTAPWEDGDNSYAYVRCPHCGCENIQWYDD